MKFPFQIIADKQFDVVGCGTNAVDFLITVPHYPEFNSKIRLTDYKQLAGGEIATACAGLQRLGKKTLYVGRFGDDAAGAFGLQTLADEGVDVSLCERINGAKTQIAFILIDEKIGERTVIWERDEKLGFRADEISAAETVLRGKIFHFTPHDTAACLKLAKAARENGIINSIDIDNIFDDIEELLPLVDILITSRDLPSRLMNIADEIEALKAMQIRFGCAVAGMTLGEDGAILLCEGKEFRAPAYRVPNGCKDTTGAGDSFRAGLLYGILENQEIENALKSANAVAALKCRAVGARTSLPTIKELTNLILENNII